MKPILFIASILFSLFFFVGSASAQTPTTSQCTTPGQVQNVSIDYPNCVGNQCNFQQASCMWDSLTGAATYNVTVTEVETSTTVYNQSVAAGTTNITFNVNQNKTYQCNVAGVNSCGTAGTAGTYSLFCQVDAGISTPAPTAQPIAKPTLAPTGIVSNTIAIGLASVVLLMVGAFLVIL